MPESNANAMATEPTPNTNQWTLQAFSEINGQPWMALQEHAADGSIERQITGFEHELRQTAQQNNITPRVLPPTSEEQFYASLSNNGRDYELGRQFAAEPANGIPQHLAPLDLGQFSKGLEDREFEQKIRLNQRESLVSAFEQYGLDTGFETAAQARTWAESEVKKIFPAAQQTADTVSAGQDTNVPSAQTNRAEQRQRVEPEQEREENVAQSYGMAV
jgi:hypothetical protein